MPDKNHRISFTSCCVGSMLAGLALPTIPVWGREQATSFKFDFGSGKERPDTFRFYRRRSTARKPAMDLSRDRKRRRSIGAGTIP